MSFFGDLLPLELFAKVIIIIVLGLVTILGAVFIPKGKILVIIGGISACLIVWFVELEINL